MMNLALREFGGVFAVPALFAPDASAKRRTVEFFTAHIRNANTRRAYATAGDDFARWCRGLGICDLCSVQPVHVATYVEQLSLSAPSVKQRLAALRSLFDWLVVGQVLPANPAASVRGPRHSVRTGSWSGRCCRRTRPHRCAARATR